MHAGSREPPRSTSKDEAPAQEQFAVTAPAIALPKGGGAIRGIGEKFTANPVTGTGSMSVPIAVSPGRSGFGPQLSLTYDSGAGNGVFGLGWQLSLPSITRKTDKGLPRYFDADDSDVFILSGAEDLVPAFQKVPDTDDDWVRGPDGRLAFDDVSREGYRVRRYRPRIEGLFALIERWTSETNPADVFWRSISKDNITTFYGLTEDSRVQDPVGRRAFSWLICESYDDKGNAILYDYKREDDTGADRSRANERNREHGANRHLKSIRYGNTRSHVDPAFTTRAAWRAATAWLFEVVFDYGEHDPDAPTPGDAGEWLYRQDPFSAYRATFEVRTNRLCRRVLMFHHFPNENIGADCLVKSTDFVYRETPALSLLASVTQCGYRRETTTDPYVKRSLPPVEFTHSPLEIQSDLRDVDASSLENLPVGLDETGYQWVDLDGEGISGILSPVEGAWYYKRNLSPVSAAAHFAPVEVVAERPAVFPVGGTGWQFQDLAGDGQPDLAMFGGAVAGFFERNLDGRWGPFTPFRSAPNVDWGDPNLRFVDLTGDGHADLLITEDDVFTWYLSKGEDGFAASRQIPQSGDSERGPRVVFDDGEQSIHLSDMSGDGLTDLVRIRNGEICYWPNLGYGHFGAKVTMDRAPWFDAPDQFSQSRVRLADIDGSGVTDLIYLGRHQTTIYFNQAGNSWSAGESMPHVPRVDNLAQVHTLDLLGNGTTCLVWSSPAPAATGRTLRYIDLMGGTKPHLLQRVVNNLGAETRIQYAASTKFYLQDKASGHPWVTKLPFPVHVVEAVTMADRWRHAEYSTTYSYHHGYFDGVEREFRGFGRVEVLDAQSYGQSAIANADSPYVTPDQTLYQPPVKTVTWFHTGAMLDRDRILSQFAHEYFPHSLASLPWPVTVDATFTEKPLADPPLEALKLTTEEWREALRACKGLTLRQEVYELDVDELDRSGRHVPVRLFSAAAHNCAIQRLQPCERNQHAVYLVSEDEALTYHYELDLRPPAGHTGPLVLEPDPRIAHTINLAVDEYGNVEQALAIGYPRVRPLSDPGLGADAALVREVQSEQHIAYTDTRYAGDAIDPATGTAAIQYYRLRVPCEVRAYELTGMTPTLGRYFDSPEARTWDFTAIAATPYHQLPQDLTPTLRLVERVRTLFFNETLTTPLPLGEQGRLAMPYERYKLALTDALLEAVFDPAQLDDAVPGGGDARARVRDQDRSGYLFAGGEYWIKSGVAGFAADAPAHFYLPERYTNAFSKETRLSYDLSYDLFVESSRDPMGNTVTVSGFDYRVLSPAEMTDASGNVTRIAFDAMGLPVASAVMGREGTESGDDVAGLILDLAPGAVAQFFASPYNAGTAAAWLGSATARFVYDFGAATRPSSACSIIRETHVLEGGIPRLQTSIEYSDGLGAVLVKKAQAEPDPDDPTVPQPLRWIASGKTVLNNKGKPVKQYEPYFSAFGHVFHPNETATEVGVTALMYYDAVGRLMRTELPDGAVSRIEFSPWEVKAFDPNDAVEGTRWHADRGSPAPTGPMPAAARPRAAWLAARHRNTPTRTLLDSLGRETVTVAHNKTVAGVDDRLVTFSRLDAEGKPLWVRDPLAHLVMQYVWPPRAHLDQPRTARTFGPGGNPNADIGTRAPTYDLAGNVFFQHSMDAGDRWMVNDAAGQPMVAWDVNDRTDTAGNTVRERRVYVTDYDSLHRPTALWLRVNAGTAARIERYEYQDGLLNDLNNLNGQLVRQYDPSGLTETIRRDYAGNIREETRRLNNQPAAPAIDWANNPQASLSALTFARLSDFDALGRLTRQFNWHRSAPGSPVALYEPRYNERGSLVSESLTLRLVKTASDITTGPATTTSVPIQDVRYDEKGQKTFLALGNGTLTQYEYDRETFRLAQVRTTSPADSTGFPARRSGRADARIVQQLLYTYDAAGNITEVEDQAFEPVFFQNQAVEARSLYEYDALYQLIRARGRENGALRGAPKNLDASPVGFPRPAGDPNELRTYTQTYQYDRAGNIKQISHDAGAGSWTRDYTYAFEVTGEPASNRLLQTVTGTPAVTTTYAYDPHGNLLNLDSTTPAFDLRWDHRDMLHRVNLGGGGWSAYQYSASKQRVRKRVDNQNGFAGSWERISLGGYELYRRFNAAGDVVELMESHHVMQGDQRVLLVDDVITAADVVANPRPDGLTVRGQTLFRYQYSNLLGSSCLELDDGRRVISYEEYHPYGTSAYRASGRAVQAPPKRYRYSGMERDEETGLNYHGARYCATWLGRWCSPDPTGIADGPNVFAYVRNKPLHLEDKRGTAGTAASKATGKAAVDAARSGFNVKPSDAAQLVEELTVQAGKGGSRLDFVKTWLVGLVQHMEAWEIKGVNLKKYLLANGQLDVAKLEARFSKYFQQIYKHRFAMYMEDLINPATGTAVEENLKVFIKNATPAELQQARGTIARLFERLSLQAGLEVRAEVEALKQTATKGPKSGGFTTVGGLLNILGVALAGLLVYQGIEEWKSDQKGMSAVSMIEAASNLALQFVPQIVLAKYGTLVAGGTAGAVGVMAMVAGFSLMLMFATIRSAIKGEDTPVDVADKYYGTKVGDLHTWFQRQSWVPEPLRRFDKDVENFKADLWWKLTK